MTLPAGYRIEHPALTDAEEILTLIHASEIAAIAFPDTDKSEIVEALTKDSWLIRDQQGQLAGWGYLDAPSNSTAPVFCEAYARPGETAAIQATLITLLLDSIRDHVAIAKAGAISTETEYIQVLTDAGFRLQRQQARLTLPLTGTEQRPQPTPGYRLRAPRATELDACHKILRTAFADTAEPFDHTADELAAMSTLQWNNSLIAETTTGNLTAVLLTSTQSINPNEAWIKWLAVLPEHRGQGLGTALLQTAFADFAQHGRTAVGLGVDITNPTGAYRLYESLGMTTAYTANIYELRLTGADSPTAPTTAPPPATTASPPRPDAPPA